MATDNPLSAFFRGFQGAQQRAIQQAQQIEANALTEQLRQIQLLNAQRQMQEALKTPEQRAQEALTAQLITQAVQSGGVRAAEPGLQGLDVAIAQALAPQTQAALEAGQITPQAAIATVPQVEFETPVAGVGGAFTRSPVLEREAQAAELARIQATADARRAPPGTQYIMTDQGLVPLPKVGPAPTEVAPIKTTSGETLTKTPPARTAATRELTPNARAAILAKAGTAGITLDDINTKYTKDGVVDYDSIIIDSNKTLADDKKLAAQERAKQIPAADRSKATGFIAAYDDLNSLTETVKTFQVQGREPGIWSRAVGTALEQPPDGVLSALYQSVIGETLTADDRQLNALKARVRGAVTKANAGLSQTEREIANVTQYVPTTNDTFEQTLAKAAGLQDYIKNQVTAITTDPREWLESIKTTQGGATAPRTGVPQTITPSAQKYLQKLGR